MRDRLFGIYGGLIKGQCPPYMEVIALFYGFVCSIMAGDLMNRIKLSIK